MDVTGEMTGWFLVGSGAGGMILPWVIGHAFVGYGAGAMPILVAGAVVLNLLAVLLFVSRPNVQAAIS